MPLLKTDYILRLIEEAVRAVTRAKDQRLAGDLQGARATLDRTLEDLLGLPLSSVLRMPLQSLVMLLGGAEQLDVPRALTLARLLLERGLAAGPGDETLACHRCALGVYDEVTRLAPQSDALQEHEACIAALLASLEGLAQRPEHRVEPTDAA